jgi:signal transduction histidine kinase
MHDILAHAVSLMVVQAEAGPVVLRTDPARAERAFDAIADAGRDARAGRVTVELAWLPESLQVSVTDDGAGPGPGTPPAGTA